MSEKKGGCWKLFAIGCVVVVLLGGIGGYLAFKNLPKLAAIGIEKASDAMLKELGLPEEEFKKAKSAISSFTQDIRDGKISAQQGAAIMEALAQESLVGAIMVRGFEAGYIEKSKLTAEEKTAARITLSRAMHGMVKENINGNQLESAMESIMVTSQTSGGNTNKNFKKVVTDEELKTALKKIKSLADNAGIPNKEYKADIGQLIKDAIAKGMAKVPAGAPVTQ
ncbi:MAG: hypothetical protein KAI43_08525 [Candidatus Aureabacteria bacterium]|nr:hypothetical protein [Candidatus Auribacterota bacterium]